MVNEHIEDFSINDPLAAVSCCGFTLQVFNFSPFVLIFGGVKGHHCPPSTLKAQTIPDSFVG